MFAAIIFACLVATMEILMNMGMADPNSVVNVDKFVGKEYCEHNKIPFIISVNKSRSMLI